MKTNVVEDVTRCNIHVRWNTPSKRVLLHPLILVRRALARTLAQVLYLSTVLKCRKYRMDKSRH